MKYNRLSAAAAFSLIEVTLAFGVATVSLLAIFAMFPVSLKTNQSSIQQTVANGIISQIAEDLRAAARLPPGQVSKQFSLHPHNGGPWDPTPDYIYFTDDAQPTGTNQSAAPADAIYRATITYRLPPTDTTSLADVTISWPAAQSDLTKVAGSVEMFIAINR
jgi:Tfp pilus assembly protein PilV